MLWDGESGTPPTPITLIESKTGNPLSHLSLREAALGYAFRGLRVLPCRPRDKKPPLIKEWQKQASTNAEQIKHWWDQHPDANVACATGQASGVFALDIDLPDGPDTLRKLEAKYDPLPATLTQQTGGGGLQMFFRYPVDRKAVTRAGDLGPNLDVRGENGYSIMPPSIHPNGKMYTWASEPNMPVAEAPEWLLRLVCTTAPTHADAQKCPLLADRPIVEEAPALPELGEPSGAAAHSSPVTPASPCAEAGRTTAWARAAFEAEVRAVADAQEGTRNDTLNKAAFALGSLVAGGVLDEAEVEKELYHAARRSGLDGPEIGKTITSGLEAGKRSPRSQPPERPCGTLGVASGYGAAEAEEGADPRPVLIIREGELPVLADQSEQALLAAGESIYQRGGQLVRVARLDLPQEMDGTTRDQGAVIIKPVDGPWLTDRLARAARFVKLRKSGDAAPANPPAQTAQVLISRAGSWKFQALRGLLACPGLRANGGLITSPGYDEASGFYLTDAMSVHVPEAPSREEAGRALDKLDRLLCEFPFAAQVDKSVALALLLTPFVRGCGGKVPLFVISAPTRGTGKSTLVRVVATLATGRGAPVLAATSSGEELEKRLTSALLAGDTMVLLDNYNGELRSNLLSQAVTEGVMNVRPLGVSEPVLVDASGVLWIANGNGITVAGDLTRRALKCTLDAGLERPEGRTFKGNPERDAREHRTELATAVLTLLRSYHAAGCPGLAAQPQWAGFDVWSKAVRGPLVWLGLPDPYESAAELVEDDPERELLLELLTGWHEHYGERRLSVKDLWGYASEKQTWLLELLRELSGDGAPLGEANPRKIGCWLKANAGRIVDGLKLTRAGAARDGALWCVKKVV